MAAFDIADLGRRMNGAVDVLQTEFSGLRTGRASVNLLDPVSVDMYGSKMPLNQVGSVNAPEPRLLTVQVWDQSAIKAVEKAIRDAGLGLNPQVDGNIVRIPIPDLNEERRIELKKVAGKYAEAARVSVRNVRQDGMQNLKRMQKDGDISEDEQKKSEGDVQALTDKIIQKIDTMLSDKERDIMTV